MENRSEVEDFIETDTSLIQIPKETEPVGDEEQSQNQGPQPDAWGLIDEDGDGIIVEEVKGQGYSGYMMVVLDPSRVILGSVPSLYQIRGFTVEEMVGISVRIANDANVAALGEAKFGCGKGAQNTVMLTLGTGVGGGMVLNGKLYEGNRSAGAELGHSVIVAGGEQCTCGRKGCLEAYCSATALVKLTKEKFEECPDSLMREMCENDVNRVGGKTAFAAMKKGDKAGAEVVDTFISYLACGVANLINIFQPEVFTIGGGVSGEGDNLLIPLKEKVCQETYSKDNTLKTDLRIATLGNDAGIIGAAAFATSR
jgi:glucokinase-like ROK family protein